MCDRVHPLPSAYQPVQELDGAKDKLVAEPEAVMKQVHDDDIR